MAGQDQHHVQNCTDNGTIAKEDEMHLVPISDSSSTISNISLQPFSNKIAIDEILKPVVALDEVVEPALGETVEPVVVLHEILEPIKVIEMANQDQHQHHAQNCIDNGTIEKDRKRKRCQSDSSSTGFMTLSDRRGKIRKGDDDLENSAPVLSDDEFLPKSALSSSPTFYSTTPMQSSKSCPPPLFYTTALDEEEALSCSSTIFSSKSCPTPSFYRTALDEEEGITKDELFTMPRGNYVIVRPMVSTDNNVLLEDDWEIPEELAVCNFCFKKLIVQEIMMKTKCGCKDALVHEACALNKKCHSCGKNVDKIKVTLLIKPNSVEVSKVKREKKSNMFSLFKF